MPLSTFLEQRNDALTELEQIHASAEAVGRDLTTAERARWDQLMRDIRGLDVKIVQAREGASAIPLGALDATGNPVARSLGSLSSGPGLDATVAIGPGGSIAEWAARRGGPDRAAAGQYTLGRYLRAMVNGDQAELAALSGTVGDQGGFAVPFGVVAQVLDLARSQTVCIAAGARTIPVETRTWTQPRLAADPTAAWVAEAATIPQDAAMVFDALESPVHKLAALVLASKELLADVPSFDAFMTNALSKALALQLDIGALRGDGVNKPGGIKTFPGTNQVAVNATPTNYDKIVDGIVAVRTANFEPTAMVVHPRDAGTLAKLKDTTNQPLTPPADVAALKRFPTTSIPTNQGAGSNESDIFLGDFAQLVFVMRTTFGVQILAERYADQGQVGFLAEMRADALPLRETAFVVLTGVKP